MIFSKRRYWFSDSSRRHRSRSGRNQNIASQAFSSSHGLAGAVIVTVPAATASNNGPTAGT